MRNYKSEALKQLDYITPEDFNGADYIAEHLENIIESEPADDPEEETARKRADIWEALEERGLTEC